MRTAFIGLRVDYNWMQIVTADVATLLGRLRIFAPLVATYGVKETHDFVSSFYSLG
jgi:hypothetical protein